MIKNGLKILLFCCVILSFTAQARKATMIWYVRPNVAIANAISAISPSLSATCSTNINSGKISLAINGQKRSLTSSQNAVSFPRITGVPLPGGKFSYSYTILWNGLKNQVGVFTLKCTGDNHLTY